MDCFGSYQPESRCDSCQAIHQCIDLTIELDGYYDELAEREEATWQLLEEGAACASSRRIRTTGES